MSSSIDDYLRQLPPLQNPEGGWGYYDLSAAQVEPTCIALLALHHDPQAFVAPIAKGLACLSSWQDADGAVRVRGGEQSAVWPTAQVLFVQSLTGQVTTESQERAKTWLLNFRGRQLEVEDVAAYRRDFEIDPDLMGWPWVQDTFSWVEPTAWACLALRRAGCENHPRVQEGLRLLLDRAMDEGGINYGNRRVFGRATEPIPTVTALMLLAFAGRDDHPRLQAAREFLLGVVPKIDDLESLSWIRLAFAAWPDDARTAAALPPLATKITDAYEARKTAQLFALSPVREALTALALAPVEASPFRWASAASAATLSPNGADHSAAHQPSDSPGRAPTQPRASIFQRFKTRFQDASAQAMIMLKPPPLEASVHIAPIADYDSDIAGVLGEQYASFREQVPLKGKRVVLKPNMVEYHRGKVINTDPRVIAAVIELCRREGASEVLVAEGPGHWRNTEYLVTASGLGDVLRHHKVPFIDLNHDAISPVPNLGRLTRLEQLYFAKTIATADVVISLPKMKTHHWAGVTLSLKNMFGTLPGICYGWPKNLLHWRGIENSIVDIALARAPDLAIVDGIVAMEGDGPLNGTAKPMGVVVMGRDPLAVDATCCRLMQLDPAKVGHLSLAAAKKIGQIDAAQIKQLGESIAARSQPFETIAQFIPLHGPERQKQVVA